MGTRTEHAPGTFSWVDLTTSDSTAAKDFYGGLLGWEFEDCQGPVSSPRWRSRDLPGRGH